MKKETKIDQISKKKHLVFYILSWFHFSLLLFTYFVPES